MITRIFKNRITRYGILSVLLLFPSLSAANNAAQYHSLENIKKQVRNFIVAHLDSNINRADLVIELGRIDQRLRLNQCPSRLELNLPRQGIKGGNATVLVKCNGVKPWLLHIPIVIRQFKKIAVSNRPLQSGIIITEQDFSLQKRNIYALSAGYIEDKEKLVDKVILQNLPAGTALNMRQIGLPIVIKRGQLIALQIKNNSIEVRSKGKALQDGAIGERIKVKNTRSDRIVEGIIVNSHLVDVGKSMDNGI